jgi:hypothetical protein
MAWSVGWGWEWKLKGSRNSTSIPKLSGRAPNLDELREITQVQGCNIFNFRHGWLWLLQQMLLKIKILKYRNKCFLASCIWSDIEPHPTSSQCRTWRLGLSGRELPKANFSVPFDIWNGLPCAQPQSKSLWLLSVSVQRIPSPYFLMHTDSWLDLTQTSQGWWPD